jgi:hypothetical protein
LPPATRDGFLAALGAAQTAARSSVVSKGAKMSDSHWSIWTSFLDSLQIDDPYLIDFPDPIRLLQVFAEHIRSGQLTPSGDPIQSCSVEDYVRSVGQEIASLGALDPRVMVNGKIELCLKKQLKGYARQDAPPECVKPIPMPLRSGCGGLHLPRSPPPCHRRLWRHRSIFPPPSGRACLLV